ncbi:hypothetical protein C8R44DRAFT_101299 [Mycena epipterygia]|nr:hypothetical protein C8R44DRAFT_101299 [Mycena epipterygia]
MHYLTARWFLFTDELDPSQYPPKWFSKSLACSSSLPSCTPRTTVFRRSVCPTRLRRAPFLTFDYLFEAGKAGHVLRNITAELMVGKAEDNGQDVADIICDHVADQDPVLSFDFFYQAHAATPAGNYHIRMNGTVFDTLSAGPGQPGTPVSNTTFRSKTFTLSSGAPFACTTPTWTPVVSLADPGYSPLRLGQPNGGDTFFLTNLSTIGTIQVSPYWVDESFTFGKIPLMTMELVESGTGKSAGSVTINDTTQADQFLPVSSFTLSAGAWKVRTNFTSTNHGGNFVTLSDEFYIASSAPCVGLQGGNSTTSGSSPSTSSGSSSKPSGGLNTVSVPFARLFVLALSLVAGATAVLA